MMKREPGFMGLAKQKAKRSKQPLTPEQQQYKQQVGGMIQADRAQSRGMMDKMSAWQQLQDDKQRMTQVPEQYETDQGEMESLAYVSPEEMAMLKRQGGSGEMTPYGIPSFKTSKGGMKRAKERKRKDAEHKRVRALGTRDQSGSGGGGSGGGGSGRGTNIGDASAAQLAAEKKKFADYKAGEEARNKEAADARMKEYRESERAGYIDEYGGYKDEYGGLKDEAKGITGQLGEGAAAMGAYAPKFDQLGQDIRGVGAAGQDYFQGAVDPETGQRTGGAAQDFKTAAGAGQTEMERLSRQYKGVTGQGMVDAAKKGQEGYEAGAADVGAVKGQFGKEGFQAEAGALQDKVGGYESKIAGMADKAMSGEVGQSQAAMLKGQMEEGRMASQKGSEEKLRRSLAQSGASPSEIAAKVAQFQKQSAGQQAQASRSEALSSTLQGQQMGQAQLGQAAGLTGQAMGAVGQQAGMLGQRAGMAGQQASLGAQQAALRGQGAAMQMQGAQGQQQAQLASLQGQAAMGQAAAGYGMQGVQGAAGLYGQGQASAMQGIQGQGQMMGQGIGALQAQQGGQQAQLGGVQAQGGLIGEQAGMTQAQLNDIMAQQTQKYQEDQMKLQREADAKASSGGGGGGGGGILGGITSALGISDTRMKDNITLLEKGTSDSPNIYSFNYKWDKDTKWRGVMAQELLNTKYSDAVIESPQGFYMVDYTRLGFPMTQILN